jgi:hypothetical protein
MRNKKKSTKSGENQRLGYPKIKITLIKNGKVVSSVVSRHKSALEGVRMRQNGYLEVSVDYGGGFTNSGAFDTKAAARKFLNDCLEDIC